MKSKRVFATLMSLMLVMGEVIPTHITTQAATSNITSIQLNVSSKVTMYTGSSKNIKVTAVKPKGNSKKVTYKSSNSTVVKVSKKGVAKALKAGNATITVTSVANKKIKKAIKVTVKNMVKNALQNKVVLSLDQKNTLSLSLNVSATNLSFYSSDLHVVTVSEKGLLTGEKEGTAKITVKGNKGAAKGAKQVITVVVQQSAGAETPAETTKPVNTTQSTETMKPSDTTKPAVSTKPTESVITATPTEGTAATEPIGLEELESKFPTEPEYPALQLEDTYDMEVDLKEDLLSLDVQAGTIVKTKGYYAINDGGQACYEIMTYEDWWNELPVELKMVTYHNDRIGVNQVFYKNPADNYGNHRLKNGMVAKLLPNKDGYVRVEQWGLFPGRTDNNRALIHILANNHQNSKILFGKDAKYVLYYDTKNQAYQNQNGIIEEVPWWLNVNGIGNNGNEYAVMLHCRQTAKAVIGDAKNVELCGNGSTITIPENEFCQGNTADFAMIETGGYVDGLTIHGFTFDSNGLEQYQYYDETKEEYVSMRTTNHTLSYFSSAFNVGLGDKEATTAVTDGNNNKVMGETTWAEVKNYNHREKMCFNNVDIYGNTFLANGTSVDIPDGGGDDILIINPEESNNVSIHNNKMYNWGRWVLAIDLGGNGERFYNYSFKQNICIQDKSNVTRTVSGTSATPTGRNRGLGWIDFEARKCFTNLDVSENYVSGANGWAFNGNGKISENITINANNIERPAYSWKSIYPYAFEFYYVYPKNIKVTNNKLKAAGSIRWGNLSYNMILERHLLELQDH